MSDKAKAAVAAVLNRIKRDPRVAYYFDPITDSFEKLVAAHCELNDLDEPQFRNDFEAGLKFEAPKSDAHDDLVKALDQCRKLLKFGGFTFDERQQAVADADAALANAGAA